MKVLWVVVKALWVVVKVLAWLIRVWGVVGEVKTQLLHQTV